MRAVRTTFEDSSAAIADAILECRGRRPNTLPERRQTGARRELLTTAEWQRVEGTPAQANQHTYECAPLEQRICRNLEGADGLALRRRIAMALVVIGQMLPEARSKVEVRWRWYARHPLHARPRRCHGSSRSPDSAATSRVVRLQGGPVSPGLVEKPALSASSGADAAYVVTFRRETRLPPRQAVARFG